MSLGIFQHDDSEKIWNDHYRYRRHGKIIDQSIEETWRRVAVAIAAAEPLKSQAQWAHTFFELLADFKFLPSEHVLLGAGTQHPATLLDHFVMPLAEDSLSGVFHALRESALTLQQGGEVGCDFSSLRPRGTYAEQAAVHASGPVPFMKIWEAASAALTPYHGMMGILRCDHPDIEEFVTASFDGHKTFFNRAVLITDRFMQAVMQKSEWELLFPVGEEACTDTVLRHWSVSPEPVACRVIQRISAIALWEKIIHAVQSGVGVLFEDTLNRPNNLWYREWMSAATAEGDLPLPVYGSCSVGSLNLPLFVQNPFTPLAALDQSALEQAVKVATRFLDNVIDTTRFALTAQRQEMLATRRIGLGVAGLADMLHMLGISYGSDESFAFVDELVQKISITTWHTSIDLARERGVFSAFHGKKYVLGHFVSELPREIRDGIEKFGIRNSHHNGVVASPRMNKLANAVSPGIDPLKQMISTAEQQLKMHAIFQRWFDHAIPYSIDCAAPVDKEEVENILHTAYRYGLKGCRLGLRDDRP